MGTMIYNRNQNVVVLKDFLEAFLFLDSESCFV